MSETPSYYKQCGLEVFDILEAYMSTEELKGFYKGNVVKYILRYKNKNGVADLKKCRDYLDKLIELESGEDNFR